LTALRSEGHQAEAYLPGQTSMMVSGSDKNVPAGAFVARFLEPEIRAWRGKEPLWKVFWGYGVIVSGVIAVFYALAIYTDQVALQQILLLVSAGYSAWILISVWRCADNMLERYWGLFARLLTVAWAGNVVMVLTFLQFDLIAKYLGH